MPSGNGARIHLSLLLTALMLMPTMLALASFSHEPEEMGGESSPSRSSDKNLGAYLGQLGVPQTNDVSHGWNVKGNIGEAALFHRTAAYVPIQDWTAKTGERIVSGWHALGHEYPIPTNWKSELTERGIECQTFYAPQGFHCNVPGLSPSALMEAGVIGAFRLDPTDKLAPDVLPLMGGLEGMNAIMEGDQYVINVLLAGAGHHSELFASDIDVRDFYSDRFAKVVVDEKGIGWLVNQQFVEWVEPDYPVNLMNDVAADIANVDWVGNPANMGSATLDGTGVIVAVMDTGLDNAVVCDGISGCNTLNSGINADFFGRILHVESFTCGGGTDGPEDPHGHGTHVTGSVLGSGASSPPGVDYSGMAPGAQLYMQSVFSACGLATPSDYQNDIFGPAYDAGARVHTNSWGTGPDACSGADCWAYYSTTALDVDESAYAMDDMVILFAMGNDGMDCTSGSWGQSSCTGGQNGEINLGFMNRQATAKNILSIGASESFHPSMMVQYSAMCNSVGPPPCPLPHSNEKWGTEPIASDTRGDNPEGMAAFSNRGPTSEGRIKPDLVAPGTYIYSVYSSEAASNADGCTDCYYASDGTSMATPITAGSAALIIEHLHNLGYSDPASALVKAILVSGAHDMTGQYTTGGDGKNGAAEAAPNNHEGWGRLDLQGTVESSFMTDADGDAGITITTSESHSLMLSVPAGLPNFRVVLSWNDPPNSPSASKQLINDLDIALKDPSGALYDYDNDDINNLVGITVPSPDAGDWEIIVTGTNVADGPQTYYLASSNGLTITDMRRPVSDDLNSAGFQSGSIFTETTVAIGGEHICTIFDDSSLQCWGDNSFGQLGDGTTTDRLTMTPVGLETGRTAVSVSAGASHTCVTLDDSSLKCWGRNNQGQLGDGSTTNSLSPVSVALGGFPVQISAGSRHTCAVLTDASLKCWGDNSYGQLGIGSTTDSSSPVAVTFGGGEKVLAVSAGAYHTCAVLDDRSLKCWGRNDDGQLGIGSDVDGNSPADVSLGGYVVAVSAGEAHTCGLLFDQTLKCWGGNSQGQLGTGDQVSQNSPTSPILGGITSIDLGSEHSCAIDSTQVLHCWGSNLEGQIGDGTTNVATSPITISIDPVLGAISVASGDAYSCVTASNDLLRCWGGVDVGTITIGLEPSQVELPRWTYINSAERDLDDDGALNLFDTHGAGDSDGDGFPSGPTDVDDSNPARAADCSMGSYGRYICKQATVGFYVGTQGSLVMTPARAGHYVDSNGAQADTPCGIGTYQELTGQTSCDPARAGYYVDGTGASSDTPCSGGTFNPSTGSLSSIDCIGSEPGYNVPILTQISTGSYHTCAVLDDGSVSCWGDNANGQLGDGTRAEHTAPEPVLLPLGKSAVSISAGSYHSCAVLDDGSLRCWGSNEFGQLGDGTSIERTSPVSVDLGSGRTAVSVSAGESHTCALLDDSGVKCWGENSNGQIGDGTSTNRLSPVSVDLGSGDTAVSVSSGSYHTCAITDTRSVKCWGDNWHGQLGDGSTGDRISPTSIELPGNSSAVTLSSGSFHTCVGLNDGSMFCWGYNAYGQLGNGATTNSNAPSSVGLTEFESPVQVSTGMYHSCALFDSGSVSCWGGNSEGQLGDGSQTDTSIPDTVNLPVGKNALSISVGQRHSCAILDDATLYCWGYNAYGQLGDGTTANQMSPANIDLRHGSGAQIPCSIGTFQPNGSQTSCILADRGYSVPLPASLNQTGCTKGSYSNLRGQVSCNLASIGYYVDEHLADSQTACPPFNSTVQLGSINFDLCKPDFDGDMSPDVTDLDDDNDGVEDRYDFDPLDPDVSIDSDGDGIPDSLDIDDDNDGVNDTTDLFPHNQGEWKDEDNDGVGDNSDTDDDNDGRDDMFDVFPNDPEEWSDFDGDGIGDNADEDDDNDGVNDVDDNPYVDLDDAFPLDSTEWLDSDGDSIGNNQDDDDDGDGYDDVNDSFPLNPSEWLDSDGDTFGDNFDWDDNDPNEWMDSDSDQVGDNSDQCPDEEGLNDSFENFAHKLALGNKLGCPLLEGEIVEEEEEGVTVTLADVDVLDTDGDGVVDLFDPDDDGDGIPDVKDGKVNSISGDGKFSKDPTRPFGENTWLVISVSLIFLSIMGYRIFNWQRRQAAKLKSKRIRLG